MRKSALDFSVLRGQNPQELELQVVGSQSRVFCTLNKSFLHFMVLFFINVGYIQKPSKSLIWKIGKRKMNIWTVGTILPFVREK